MAAPCCPSASYASAARSVARAVMNSSTALRGVCGGGGAGGSTRARQTVELGGWGALQRRSYSPCKCPCTCACACAHARAPLRLLTFQCPPSAPWRTAARRPPSAAQTPQSTAPPCLSRAATSPAGIQTGGRPPGTCPSRREHTTPAATISRQQLAVRRRHCTAPLRSIERAPLCRNGHPVTITKVSPIISSMSAARSSAMPACLSAHLHIHLARLDFVILLPPGKLLCLACTEEGMGATQLPSPTCAPRARSTRGSAGHPL